MKLKKKKKLKKEKKEKKKCIDMNAQLTFNLLNQVVEYCSELGSLSEFKIGPRTFQINEYQETMGTVLGWNQDALKIDPNPLCMGIPGNTSWDERATCFTIPSKPVYFPGFEKSLEKTA